MAKIRLVRRPKHSLEALEYEARTDGEMIRRPLPAGYVRKQDGTVCTFEEAWEDRKQ